LFRTLQAAGGIPASTQGSEAQGNGTCSSNNSGSSSCQQPIAATSQGGSISVDALYQLIGQPCGPPKANLKPGQAQQVKQLYSRQLQEAAAAEAATVGAWQQLPHERLLLGSLTVQEQPEQGRRSLQPDDAQGPQAHKQRQQQKPSAAGALGHGMATSSLQDNCTLTSDQPAAGDSFVSEGAHGTAAAGAGSDGCSAAAGSANAGQGRPPQAAQEEHVHPSPLMHHAAIMQVAARRAAGQAVL
jgi:hypothetical protein